MDKAERYGIDRSLPYVAVVMEKPDMSVYPHLTLREGYRFVRFAPEHERAWAELQYSITHTDSLEQGLQIFRTEFLGTDDEDTPAERCPRYRDVCERMVFVEDPDGHLVGTAALWTGDTFGRIRSRVHWVAVDAKHQGKGIAGAMMTRLCELHHALGCSDVPYLTTQTWSYRAVGLYRKFGFLPYLGERPANWPFHSELFPQSYEQATEAGWALIDSMQHRGI